MAEQNDVEARYREMMAGLQLTSILIQSADFSRDMEVELGQAEATVNKSGEYSINEDMRRFRFLENLKVEMIHNETSAQIFSMTCTMLLVYESPIEVSSEMIELFADRNLQLHSWPFFREFLQNTVTRMGIPPITLPLLPPAAE